MKPHHLVAFLTALTCGSHLIADEPDFWPGWHGKHRNGWVTGAISPEKWPENLTQRWKIEVGEGYSTPVVAENKVYQHARQGDEEVVWCLDLESGNKIWRKAYTNPFRIGSGGQRHGKGPKSSPVYGEGKLFTLSITGVLSAWDAKTGDLAWRKDYKSRFGKNQPYWGVSTSPLVVDKKVIVQLGNDEKGALFAFDAATGREVWSQGSDGTSYSSPFLLNYLDVHQVVQWNHRALTGIEIATGKPLWEFPFPHVGNNQNTTTPVFHKGHVIAGGENRGVRSIAINKKDGMWSANERWHQEDVALDMSTAVINGNRLYGLSHYRSGQLFSLDIETGKVLWNSEGRTAENVMFLSVPGYVLALLNRGQLQIHRPSNEGLSLVRSIEVAPAATWAPPVLLSNRLLIKDKQHLTCWSLAPGTGEN